VYGKGNLNTILVKRLTKIRYTTDVWYFEALMSGYHSQELE